MAEGKWVTLAGEDILFISFLAGLSKMGETLKGKALLLSGQILLI